MDGSLTEERAALIALLQAGAPARPWSEITADVVEAGTARAVWQRQTRADPDALAAAARQISHWASQGWRLTTILDAGYPARLREIHQAPPVLFTRGTLIADDPAVCVVGSRQATRRGLEVAGGIARDFAARGITVVAGLARGIDTAAHQATLDAGGRTVAVVATGISRVYPPESHRLHEEIAARGLLMSQFWPDAPPQRHTFLMRNATMSGYALATVVVEAGEKSGARVQARLAVEHGRPVILPDAVVDRNEWARALARRPGVRVARRLRDVTDAVTQVMAERADVDAELQRLGPPS